MFFFFKLYLLGVMWEFLFFDYFDKFFIEYFFVINFFLGDRGNGEFSIRDFVYRSVCFSREGMW